MSSKLTKFLCLFSILLLFSGPAVMADTQDGSMSGVVLDDGGETLPGVMVSITGPQLQGERKAITDAEGRWRIPLVPVGKGYEAAAFLDGFQKVIQTDLTVNIGSATRVDFTLASGSGDLGEITVTAEAPLIDAKKTSISETITYQFMEDIPTGRSYFDAMSMAAGVAGFGNVFTHGADDTDNVFLVDGVDTTDNATGTFGMNFSYEAIQEVEMKTGAFEAEYGRATGAISNVVTKSGGNEFHGAIPVYYTDLDMEMHPQEGRNPVEQDSFTELEPGISVGGPVVRDRLWFFASYNRFERNIEGENSFGEIVTNDEIFEELMGKLTWQVNPDNKVVGQYASDPASIDSRESLNVDIMQSAYSQQQQGGDLNKLQWTSIFTPNLFLETKVATHTVNLTVWPADPANRADGSGYMPDRFQDWHNGDSPPTTFGNSTADTRITRPRDQFSSVLNFYQGDWAGEHNFKFGIEYQEFSYKENAFYPNIYVINRPNDNPDQWTRTGPLDVENDGDIATFFAQDSWTWRDNWSFNLGFRYENQTQKNDAGETAYELNNLFAPRLGFSWDIKGDGRSKAYFNFGRYYDAVGSYLGQQLNRAGNDSWYYEGDYETGQWEEITHTTPEANPTQVDPNLDPNFKDEIVAGYEFEFATDFSAGVKVIYNWQDNLIEDVIGNEAEVRAGETNDYWYYITNIQDAERTYKGIEWQLKKRLAQNYQFLLVYTLSEAEGSLANDGQAEGLNIFGDFAEVRDQNSHRYGYLPWDDRHYIKLNGAYHLPWGLVAGVSLGWRSGRPYNRVGPVGGWTYDDNQSNAFNSYGNAYFIDDRGSHRLGHVWWLDLRLTKDFNIGDTELSVIVDAFNVTNNQFVLSRREAWGLNRTDTLAGEVDENWGTANGWMGPGNFTVGLKFSF